MMRSLYSAISGLKAHQTMMDVIGNNIANVNTLGFKSSSVTFADMLSQTLKGASAPVSGTQGGSNAVQVGLGVQIGAINQDMSQGSAETTGKTTDLMIQGQGFFVLNNNNATVYTRAGDFTVDAKGDLVDASTGALVQGYMSTNGTSLPTVTTTTSTTNLSSLAPGSYKPGQSSGAELTSFTIDQSGTITGVYSDNSTAVIGQIALATVPNASGMENVGNNYYQTSNNSGQANTGTVGQNGAGTIVSGALEMSNVDLGQEMTNMIEAQRGFQANSRVITVGDTFLQTLVDLKRQ